MTATASGAKMIRLKRLFSTIIRFDCQSHKLFALFSRQPVLSKEFPTSFAVRALHQKRPRVFLVVSCKRISEQPVGIREFKNDLVALTFA